MPARSFRTDDLDEAMSIWGSLFNDHRVTQIRTAPLGFDLSTSPLGVMSAGILKYGTEIAAESVGPGSFVAIPLKGSLHFQFGRFAMTADPATAAIRSAGRPASLRGWTVGDEAVLVLGMASDALQAHLSRILGRDEVEPFVISPQLDLRTGPGAAWWNFTRTIATALDSTIGLATHPMMSAPLSEAVMTGLLLAADHPYREALEEWTRPAPPATVRRAMDVIEERAHQALSIVDIAAAVGCSVRALQIAFKKHLNETPHQHLKRVRMDRAHSMLRASNSDTSVAEIAQACGFNQVGRFAVQYRQIYGVSPKVTLRH